MGSTSATLVKTTGGTAPQAYIPSTDLYKAVSGYQVGSSEYVIQTLERGLVPFAYEAVTVTTAVGQLSSGTYANAILGIGQIQGGAVRLFSMGTSPTTALGFEYDDLDTIILEHPTEIANFRIIRASTVTTTLLMQYST